jgi:tellurite resistance protein
MHEQNIAILKALVSVAWADGRIANEEMEVIEALLQSFDATPSEAGELRSYAKIERKLSDIPVTELSYDDRRVLLQHAVLLTFIDGEQHESEKKLLDELCEILRIPGIEASGIIAAAEQRAKSFLDLL